MQATTPRSIIAAVNHKPAQARPFGPGLLAAASNNDPTTVASLAIVGATTGYALGWLIVLIVPMLALVQALAADIGVVCKTSLQGAVRRHYGLGWALVVLAALAAVNTLTLAADVKAGCEALALLTRVPAIFYVLPFAVAVGWLLASNAYGAIERYLSLLAIVFVAYAGSALLSHVDGRAFVQGLVPHVTLSPTYLSGALALLGTTLTGYVYVWESIGTAERSAHRSTRRTFERDAALGMLPIGAIFLCIFVASAATLGARHLPVVTANDMAAALEPIAGPWASTLFAVGLLASSILAVPILAAVNAYAAAHTFGWPGSLSLRPRDARAFYGVVSASLALAALVAALPGSPVTILYGASIAGGLATPITLAFLVLLARSSKAMADQRIGRPAALLGWGVLGLVTLASLAFVASNVGLLR